MPFAALILFTVVMYTAPSEWIPALAPLRLAFVTSTAALVLMLVSRVGQRRRVLVDGVRGWSLVLLTAVAAASATWATDPARARAIAVDCAKYVGIYLVIVNLVRTPRRLTVLCGTLIAASIVTSLGAIDWYRGGVDLVEGYRARWVGTYADPNRMAMCLGIVVPLAAAFAVRREVPLPFRAVCLLAGILAVIAMVYSYSRGGFIGLAVAMGVWGLRERRLARALLVGLAAIALVALAPARFWSRTETVSSFREDAAAMGRVHAWMVASRISADRPLLGVGAGNFRLVWPHYARGEAPTAYEAHNVFLQVLAELGWIGLALFLVFVGRTVEGAWLASRDEEVGWLSRGLVASVIGFLVCSLSAGFLGNSPHMFVLFGLAAAAQHAATAARSAGTVLDLPLRSQGWLGGAAGSKG